MTLNRSTIVPAVCVALILLLSLGQPSTAQNSATQQELSAHLAALIRNKWEMIGLETAGSNEEWVGGYRAYDGPTITTDLAWSPTTGFILWWYNCSRPTSARANHGAAVFENGLLTVRPEVSESVPGSFTVPSEFVPVRWGAQHYLIPQQDLLKFVYAVNSRSVPEIESFLLKDGDYNKNRKGRPGVPAQYARYLGMKPIIAAISKVGPKGGRWYPSITLNVGKRDGVIPAMKFYHFRRGDFFIIVEVTSVDEHTAEASVVSANNGRDEEDVRLRRGWRFSSRVPKGRENYGP
jgi:hypothetical protein